MKKYLTGAAVILLLLIGFWIGRATLPVEERVEYTPLPAVSGSLSSVELTPISQIVTSPTRFIPIYKELWPACTTHTGYSDDGTPRLDSISTGLPGDFWAGVALGAVGVNTHHTIDTLASYRATIEDWNMRRTYMETLFDTPELGKLSLTAIVQYNHLDSLDWSYAPIQRNVSKISTHRWIPFASVGYNTFEQGSIGIGTFYKNVGGQVKYLRDFHNQRSALGAEIMIKF